MKKNLNTKYVLIVAFLFLILIVFVILRFTSKENNNEVGVLSEIETKPASAQSYTASQVISPLEGDLVYGSASVGVKLFVYEDYTNKYSAELAETLDKLYSENQSKISINLRPFIPKNSLLAKEAALAVACAGEQDKWLAMRALLFAQAKNEEVNSANFEAYASQLNLNVEAFKTCLTNPDKSLKIEKLAASATANNVLGAPTIFIGDEMILGARPYDDYTDSNGERIEGLKSIVEKKLK